MSEQERNVEVRDAIAQVERNNNKLIGFGIFTLTCLLLLAVLTLIYVVQINKSLKTEFEHHRNETERTIQQIQSENEHSHEELLQFVRCLLLVRPEDRNVVIVDKCIEEAHSSQPDTSLNVPSNETSGSTTPAPNHTPQAPQSSVTQSTPAPVPEETRPAPQEQPVPTAPPDPEPTLLERIIEPVGRLL